MAAYPHVASRTTGRYIALFDDLISRRDEIADARNLRRNLIRFAQNQVDF